MKNTFSNLIYQEIIEKEEFQKKKGKYRKEVLKTFKFEDWKKYYPHVKKLFMQLSPDGKFHKTLVFPFNKTSAKKDKLDTAKWRQVNTDVREILATEGYTFNDQSFVVGICFNKQNKEVKISQVLLKTQQDLKNAQKEEDRKDRLKKDLADPALMAKLPPQAKKQKEDEIKKIEERKAFLERVSTSVEEYMNKSGNTSENKNNIVFTLSTRAIASQSTKTSWNSCMNLDAGINKHKVGSSLSGGAFVAWLTNTGDEVNLNGPIARVLIKPMEKKGKGKDTLEIYWYVDLVYPRGTNHRFRQAVTEILDAHNINVSVGEYKIDSSKHYVDSSSEINVDDVFKYAHKGNFKDLSKKPKEFIAKLMERYPKEVLFNWDPEVKFPDLTLNTLNLNNTDIRKMPKGIKASNYNLSNTNITEFSL